MKFKDIPSVLTEGWPTRITKAGKAFKTLLGPHACPTDLQRHTPNNGGFLLSDPIPLAAAENVFKTVLEQDSQNVEPMLQLLTCTWFLCPIPGDGDCLMAHAPHKSQCAQIVVWSHEERTFFGPVAWDIPTAVRVMDVYDANDDDEGRTDRMSPALGRFDANKWPFSFINERLLEDGVMTQDALATAAPFSPQKSNVGLFVSRAHWIAEVLSGRAVGPKSIEGQLGWTPTRALAGTALRTFPVTALYWLWRSYLLEEPWLQDILTAVEDAESKLVQDAVSLIRELLEDPSLAEDLHGLNLKEVRGNLAQMVADIRNPFKPTFTLGPLNFVRDDTQVERLAVSWSEPKRLPEPPAGQPAGPRWGGGNPALATSKGGDRYLVSGHGTNPLYTKTSYAQPTIPMLFEVDEESTATMAGASDPPVSAGYIDDDTFFIGNLSLSVMERHENKGVLVGSLRSAQAKTVVSDDGRWLVRLGGTHNYQLKACEPRTVEIYRIHGRLLDPLGIAAVGLDSAVFAEDGLYLGNTAQGVAYKACLKDLEPLERPKFALIDPKNDNISPRVGPPEVVSALGFNDWCLQAPSGNCVVLKLAQTSPMLFEIHVGDAENGMRPSEPLLSGSVEVNISGHDTAYVALRGGEAWTLDLSTAKATKVAQMDHPGLPFTSIFGEGFAAIDGHHLNLWWPGEDPARPSTVINVGPDASIIGSAAFGALLCLKAQGSPLVVLGVGDKASGLGPGGVAPGTNERGPHNVSLVGSVDPNGHLGQAVFNFVENPRGYDRIRAVKEGRSHLLALDGWDNTGVTQLPEEPWKNPIV